MKKNPKIVILFFILISIIVFANAQSNEIPTKVKVYVDNALVQDHSVCFILRGQQHYKLELKTQGHRLVSKIPVKEWSQVDSLEIRVCSTAPKRKVDIISCVRYNQRLSVSTCIVCHKGEGPFSEIVIWHPIGYDPSRWTE